MAKTRAGFIQEMERYIGTHEDPIGAGRNNSPVNYEYGAVGPAWPWCAMTVWLAATHAGFYLPKTASVYALRVWAQQRSHGLRWVGVGEAQPGDIFCYNRDSHTGMFHYRQGGGFVSVEGNWGDRCQRVTRNSWGEIAGLVRLPFEDAPSAPLPSPSNPNIPATRQKVPGTWRSGDQGLGVIFIQVRLNGLRDLILYSGQPAPWGPSDVDGKFGNQTLWNLGAFQQKFNLEADGIWGPATEGKMSAVEAALGIRY